MSKFNIDVLENLQTAIKKDYGLHLEGKELEDAGEKLFELFKTLMKYDRKGKMLKKVLKVSERPS